MDHYLLQLAALFDFVADAVVWVKDRDGRYQWVNRAFAMNYAIDHAGEGEEQDAPGIVGKTDYELAPPFLADQFRLDDEYVLTGERIVDRIELVGPPGGPASWSVTSKIPIIDGRGAVIGTAGITRPLDSPPKSAAPGGGFGPVLAHMRDHHDEAVSNRQLARLAHMSVRAFERKFLQTFHLTPQRYLRRLQLRMACRALVYTGKPLAEIASDCGFADQSHFTRAFRAYFHRTPGEYRRHYGEGERDALIPSVDAGRQESPGEGRLPSGSPRRAAGRRRRDGGNGS